VAVIATVSSYLIGIVTLFAFILLDLTVTTVGQNRPTRWIALARHGWVTILANVRPLVAAALVAAAAIATVPPALIAIIALLGGLVVQVEQAVAAYSFWNGRRFGSAG
jgi:hypothetical protein